MTRMPFFNHADPAGERPFRNAKRKFRKFCGRGDCPKKFGGRLPSCAEVVGRAQAWEASARKAEIGKQRVLATYAENKTRLDAALALLEATDRAWREGEPPPVERIRTLLSECGRGATWPG